jgi:hypothetical protein
MLEPPRESLTQLHERPACPPFQEHNTHLPEEPKKTSSHLGRFSIYHRGREPYPEVPLECSQLAQRGSHGVYFPRGEQVLHGGRVLRNGVDVQNVINALNIRQIEEAEVPVTVPVDEEDQIWASQAGGRRPDTAALMKSSDCPPKTTPFGTRWPGSCSWPSPPPTERAGATS